jgi:serine/threonine-protein kinase
VFLLAALLEKPGHLITREELIGKLWPTNNFAKNSLNVAVNGARRLLDDNLQEPQFIKTVGRKGYCFTHKVEILPVAPQTQVLSAAEGHYWKAKQLWEMRTPATLRESIHHFKESIKEDPSYALAYCGLADAYTMGAIHAIMPPKEAFPRVNGAIQRALAILPDLPEAKVSQGWVDLCFHRDTASAESLFRDAIDCKARSPFAHNGRALLYLALGRPQDSLEALQSAWNHDAISAPLTALLSNGYYYARDFDRAVAEGLKAVESEPDFPVAHACLGQALTQLRRFGEAIQHLELARDLSERSSIMLGLLGYAYGKSKRTAEAVAIGQELVKRATTEYVPAYFVAQVFLGVGKKQDAMDWLRTSFAERSHWVLFLKVDPIFDELRSDARFLDLLKQVDQKQD